ncbi:MAG: SDR family NAD(P)-dependent oxidoreductase [SAR202 cluster bacterium]|nr:SDR family NAD(P)-dependent oxidoreductase [SAR202 cluster bacterium]
MGKLDGKVAIVTGGGTGIGKGIARAFAAEGARVVIASRSEQTLNEAAGELGDQVLAVPTDLKVETQITALFERTIAEMGQLDILVNNSGVFEGGPIEELSLETWQHVVDVNLTGVFLCTREAMKIMKPAGGGRIINIGSISAQMPRMNSAPYSTTKHALVGLTKSTALEGRDFGVVASILHPGNVLTELRDNSALAQNQEPMMSTDDIAMAALTMAALPLNVNMLETIVLPVEQKYIGRG